MSEKIYVHVADDHKILIEGIIAVINTDDEIEINGYSLTGKEVINFIKNEENRVDVLVLDLTMPIVDGFEVLNYFFDNEISHNTIVLSSYDDIKIVQEILRLGAKGYITKNYAGKHIIDGIKTVAKGKQYFSDDIQKKMMNAFIGNKPRIGDLPDKFIIESLTEREIEVLKLVTREYNTTEIAEMLHLSVTTVESYRKKLLKKLKVKNAVGLAMYAVKNKIV
ncbi:response regulator [Polaribacter porphyrae]|uniref:DNA-binding response regulator n=1 Tax=Polaribacter porphyrae TaxID=1137780 RepID=A0A2S7WMS4_9FLAO|nr:response regulator transcription factor [Polaribacter porphyrae]PQJ78908.1 DNA-binding response regulator [Polaribacter porphyrae]